MRYRKYRKRNTFVVNAPAARLRWATVLALGVLAWGGHAEAALIAQFTGTVTDVSAPLAADFSIGESVVGSYQFDETTPDTDVIINTGTYLAIDDYQVQFNGGYAASAAAGEIRVGLPPANAYTYRARATSPSGPSVSGFSLAGMSLVLEDSSQTAFGSVALPVSLDLGDFDTQLFGLIFGEEFVEVELTAFTIVPEPATLALMTLGGLALLGPRRGAGRGRRSRPTRPRPQESMRAHAPRSVGLTLALVSVLMVGASVAEAGQILQPDAVSTDMGTFTTPFFPDNTRNQSGLSAGYTSLVDDFDLYVSAGPAHGSNSGDVWLSDVDNLTGFIDFSLGGTFLVESMALWNLPNAPGSLPGDSGVNTFDLFADTDAGFTSPTLLGSFSANENFSDTVPAQVFTFPETTAAYVRMAIISSHGSTGLSTTGLSEVAFEVVPEPGTLALLGLLLVGAGTGRRKRSQRAGFECALDVSKPPF